MIGFIYVYIGEIHLLMSTGLHYRTKKKQMSPGKWHDICQADAYIASYILWFLRLVIASRRVNWCNDKGRKLNFLNLHKLWEKKVSPEKFIPKNHWPILFLHPPMFRLRALILKISQLGGICVFVTPGYPSMEDSSGHQSNISQERDIFIITIALMKWPSTWKVL